MTKIFAAFIGAGMARFGRAVVIAAFFSVSCACAQGPDLPPRTAGAVSGSELVRQLTPLGRMEREHKIYSEVVSGNIPGFLRRFVPVEDSITVNGASHRILYYAAPEYLSIGSDSDHFTMPMSPVIAQQIADACSCMLPTRKMADAIYRAAAVKFAPWPIPPSPEMITMPVFERHQAMLRAQAESLTVPYAPGALVAGTKKDVIISNDIYSNLKPRVPRPVVIYGWHKPDGTPIQPRYNGHNDLYADYSHGIRLVCNRMIVDGKEMTAEAVLKDPELCGLLSDEGPISAPRYPVPSYLAHRLSGFHDEGRFGEQVLRFTYPPDIAITINAPQHLTLDPSKRMRLIFYALPNGNTTAQTAGKKMKQGDDWHFDIQHIAAQTRFLRSVETERNIVTVYLENSVRSWGSAWSGKQADPTALVHHVVDSVMNLFAGREVDVTLNGHSGGGNFIFTYLDSASAIPDCIERIAFLDSDYRYNDEYGKKLAIWLNASPARRLCVLAYNDSIALLNGKPFVSATGGTWHRTKMMKEYLAREFPFTHAFDADSGIHRYTAPGGRVEILLKENPKREIYHTVQVELNGFIHSCLSGTVHESEGYAYYRSRAYTQWIDE